MKELFHTAVYCFIGYLVGTWLSDYMFMDFSKTVYTNAWVYFWILLWPFGLIYQAIISLGYIAIIIVLLVCICGGTITIGTTYSNRRNSRRNWER